MVPTPIEKAMIASPAEGSTAFLSRGATLFRYKITTAGESMSIWLEDRKSKQQWGSGMLKISNIVASSNAAIPGFKAVDYVTCFAKCLETESRATPSGDAGAPDEVTSDSKALPTNDCGRDFYQEDNTWYLEFSLSLRLWSLVSSPAYRIAMEPIELKETDVLMARVRDQEEMLERLASDLELATKRITTLEISKLVHLVVTTEKDAAPAEILVWSQYTEDKSATDNFAVNEDGTIQFKVAGMYAIHLDVVHQNKDPGSGVCELRFGGESVHTFFGPDDNGDGAVLNTMCLLEVQAGELVSVANTGDGDIEDPATMSIFLV